MPLHNWSDAPSWDSVHLYWTTELARHIKGRLPPSFRAYIGTAPAVAIDAPPTHPDVSVRATRSAVDTPERTRSHSANPDPDVEVAVAAIDPPYVVFIEQAGRLIAALELISPRNKDRPDSRAFYLNRYLSYLHGGVNLALIDVHRTPIRFSFADRIAAELVVEQAPLPSPMAVSYRVGEPAATGGRMFAIWRRPLVVGAPLASLPLPLTVHESVVLDLETTYMTAARDAYLEE